MKSFLKILIHDNVVLVLILLNSILVFLNAFDSINSRFGTAIFIFDYVISVFFVLEMALKIYLQTWSKYWLSGWNIFDFTIVFFSSPILLSPLIGGDELSFIIILRLLRILRFFRMLRFIPDRQHIATGIIRSLKASMGVFLIILLYNFVLSLCAVYLFREAAPAYFTNPIKAMYAIFCVFTIDGWYEIPEAIAANSTEGFGMFARLYFVFTVFTGGILGLSLANAVFVDQMTSDNVEESEKQIRNLQVSVEDLKQHIELIEELVSSKRSK